jgi:hypothetical protein
MNSIAPPPDFYMRAALLRVLQGPPTALPLVPDP